jgi:multiple sugar transport system permease protein
MTRSLGRQAILLLVAAAFLAPIVIAGLTAVMTTNQVGTDALWPQPWAWSNFGRALRDQPLLRMAGNTLFVAALSTVGVLLTSIPAAYALARMTWRGRDAALLLVIAAFLLPAQVSAIPLYAGFAHLGWIGTYAPLIVPSFLGDAFSIFLLRQFFVGVPDAMTDACRLEGGGEWRVLLRVVLPMSRPGVAAVALLHLMYMWNDFFAPYLYIGERPERWTLAIGLAQYRGLHHVDWNLTMAAATLVSLPIVAVFLLAQRALTDGVAAQAPG